MHALDHGTAQDTLDRLEAENGRPLLSAALTSIRVSRGGLKEAELLRILRREGEETLPRAVWSGLYHSLETFLRPSGDGGEGTIDYFHRSFADAVERRYFRSFSAEVEVGFD